MNTLESLLDDLVSGDETRAEAAVPQLVEMGEAAIPSLLDLTRSTDADVRWWGLRALAASPHVRTEWLIPFLSDPTPEVRQCAALGLASRPDESAVQPLVHALNDEDSIVVSLAGNALVKIGGAAVPSLIEVVKRPPESAVSHRRARGTNGVKVSSLQSQRIHALRALAEIRDHRAIPVMMQVMQEDSALLQHWAQEGLERLGLDMVYIKPL